METEAVVSVPFQTTPWRGSKLARFRTAAHVLLQPVLIVIMLQQTVVGVTMLQQTVVGVLLQTVRGAARVTAAPLQERPLPEQEEHPLSEQEEHPLEELLLKLVTSGQEVRKKPVLVTIKTVPPLVMPTFLSVLPERVVHVQPEPVVHVQPEPALRARPVAMLTQQRTHT